MKRKSEMKNLNIYEDGTAELSLIRSMFPVAVILALPVIAWHFGGFESQTTEIDRILATLSGRLAWISLFAIPVLGLFVLWANPPQLKLSPLWVGRTVLGALATLAIALWFASTLAG
jgi:uncharacterized membrane protein